MSDYSGVSRESNDSDSSSSSGSEEDKCLPAENYNWTTAEVEQLNSTVLDLQTKVYKSFKTQQIFKQLITRVTLLEQKINALEGIKTKASLKVSRIANRRSR